jgi:hypothetical protein
MYDEVHAAVSKSLGRTKHWSYKVLTIIL